MKFISKILKIFWAVWCLIAFVISGMVVFPCFFIIFTLQPDAYHFAHAFNRLWGKFLMIAFFIKVRVHGKELIDKTKTYVFISNHQSQLDIPICIITTPMLFRYLAKAELKKFPVVGYVISKLYVFVDRGSSEGRIKGFEEMMKSLDEGISVFIYPEGTRNRGPQKLKAFFDGAFRLAIETKTPLSVLTIVNSGKLLSPNTKFEISPGIIDCYWEEPIDTSSMTMDDLPKLKQTVQAMMMNHLKKE